MYCGLILSHLAELVITKPASKLCCFEAGFVKKKRYKTLQSRVSSMGGRWHELQGEGRIYRSYEDLMLECELKAENRGRI